MTNNMYRVGDYVYFETSSTSPYQIRRIEELNKTPSGNVEAKVMCFYRRRDVSSSLILVADKHQSEYYGALEEDDLEEGENGLGAGTTVTPSGEELNQEDRHQLRHRELFLSRQIETLPATHIRGKCIVTLLNETEALLSYLNKEDTFFYSLVYDPQQKTLLADKGEIRVGSRYQSDITNLLKEGEDDGRKMEDLEHLVWTPYHGLTDRQIDQFLVISRSVGTFARALDCSSSVKQPSLHMSAAAASRDVTLFHAMDTLHKHHYDLSKAVCSLVPSSGPVLCRDEMEEWSASEANLFEEALEKYGKDFNDIRQDFLPWKTLKNIIEYYYMWKTTDRYVQQKRVKAVEAESKLKQVYIPNYNKPNPAALTNGKNAMVNGNGGDIQIQSGKPCESCQTTSSPQWYAWGPSHLQYRLCSTCWMYWKKFGGLKLPSRIAKEEERMSSGGGIGGGRVHRCSVVGCSRDYKTRSQLMRHAVQAHGITLRPGSPRPIMKTRNAFFLHTSLATRIMRRLCPDIIQPRKVSRNPTWPINPTNMRQESLHRLGGKSFDDVAPLVKSGTGKRTGKVADVSIRLGQNDRLCPGWMLPTERNRIPKQPHIAYPKPPKGPDGSLIYTPVPNREIPTMNSSPSLLKRRAYEETNGMDGVPPHKKPCKDPIEALDPYHLSQLGVNPPPGLTVTPVGLGVNGGPVVTPPEAATPPPLASQLPQPQQPLQPSQPPPHPPLSVQPLPHPPQLPPHPPQLPPHPPQLPPHPPQLPPHPPQLPPHPPQLPPHPPQLPPHPPQLPPHSPQLPPHPPQQPPHPQQQHPHPQQQAILQSQNLPQSLPPPQLLHPQPSLLPPPPPPAPAGTVPPTHSGGGRVKVATVSRIAGRPRIISSVDAPDDVYFYASESTKKLRRTLTTCDLKRAARRPFRKVPSKEEVTE